MDFGIVKLVKLCVINLTMFGLVLSATKEGVEGSQKGPKSPQPFAGAKKKAQSPPNLKYVLL